MRNIRLVLAYDGTDFCGWQRQPDAPTIQSCLEGALHKLTGAPTQVCGSGRTDAGVHAAHQVANFHTTSTIPCANFVKALNNLLPPTVRVKAADDVADTFHARYDARRKTYRYRILMTPVCSPLLWRFVYHHPHFLNRARMAEAARFLEGEHDFTSFAAADGQGDEDIRSNVRAIYRSHLLWRPRSSMLVYEVTGKGFLRYMVRNIVGTLIEVGRGKLVPADVLDVIAARNRMLAGPTAPAQGLCLMKVEYDYRVIR
ncbi:MAG: tRNA pseudouridine(38-40) synthase TruA [Terriglobia bacterium]